MRHYIRIVIVFASLSVLLDQAVARTGVVGLKAVSLKQAEPHYMLSGDWLLSQLALVGASRESMLAIYQDLDKAKAFDAKGVLEVQGHQIFVNGKKIGITIESQNPMRVLFHGQSWAYDKTLKSDVNYFALKKMLTGNRKGFASLLLPSAYGQSIFEETTDSGSQAATAGFIAGAATATSSCAVGFRSDCNFGDILNSAAWKAVLSGIIGSTAGFIHGEYRQTKDMMRVTQLLHSGLVSCSEDSIIIRSGDSDFGDRLEFELSGSFNYQSGDETETGYLSDTVRQRLIAMKAKCSTPEQALDLQKKMRVGVLSAKGIQGVRANTVISPSAGPSGTR